MKITASQFLQELADLDMEKLKEIRGLGPIMIENLQKFLQSENCQKLQKKFEDLEKLNKGLKIDFDKIKSHKTEQKIETETEAEIEKKLKFENENQRLEKDLTNNLTNIKTQESQQNQQIVCITGTFAIPRNQIVDKLEEKGFETANSLTKNVTILLAGEKSGSKLGKAVKMGIKIVQNLDELI